MLARVADSIYWMSRYVERAENVARFIEVNLNLMLDLPVGSTQQWQPLVEYRRAGVAEVTVHGAISWVSGTDLVLGHVSGTPLLSMGT